MNENKAIKQSLQEIATLLYYMYDHYLKDLVKSQSLDALVAFLGDLGLLGNRVSVFEAEEVRDAIVSQAAGTTSSDAISYEQFYSWLRGVSAIYYATEVDNSRKALHMMLTQKIIPLASSWGTFKYSSRVSNGVNGSMLMGMSQHQVFLRYWYFHISHEPSQKITNEKDIWTKVVQNNSLASLSSLMQHFEKLKLIPQKIEAGVVKTFALVLVKIQLATNSTTTSKINSEQQLQQDRQDEQKNVLSFSDFIQIIGFMSTHVESYAHRFMPHSAFRSDDHDSKKGYHVGWHVIMQTAAEYFLQAACNKWLVYEFDSNKYTSSVVPSVPSSLSALSSGESNKALGISHSTLLWICRQGNLINSMFDIPKLSLNIENVSMQYTENVTERNSLRSIQSDHQSDSTIVPTSKIPSLLSTLASHHGVQRHNASHLTTNKNNHINTKTNKTDMTDLSRSIIYEADNSSFQYSQALIGSSDVATEASVVALAAPSLFFASPQPLPSLLQALYTPGGARCLRLLSSSTQRILTEINSQSQSPDETDININTETNTQSTDKNMISLTKFVKLFQQSSVVPLLVTEDVLLKMACYILGKEVNCGDGAKKSPGSIITEREFIDLLFACSQMIFGGMTESFSPSSDSIILTRHTNYPQVRTTSPESKSMEEEEVWEWQTAASNDEKLLQLASSFVSKSNSPHIGIADRIDRLYCLLELVDPAARHLSLVARLNVNNASAKKQMKLPFVIGGETMNQPSVNRSQGGVRMNNSENVEKHQKKITQTRMLGKLLEFIFLESNQWTKLYLMSSSTGIHADQSHSSPAATEDENNSISFFQNVLTLLFLQYPPSSSTNSLSLTPWDIADILSTSAATRNDINYENDSKQGFVHLMMDLRYICAKYTMTMDDFERYLSYLLLSPVSNAGGTSKSPSTNFKLSISKLEPFFPYLLDMFSPTNLNLLKDGFPLILWSYLCSCRGNSGHLSSQLWNMNDQDSHHIPLAKVNPFLEDVTALFPTRGLYLASKEYGIITLGAARNWALLQDIDAEICDFCFRLCVDMTGNTALHFSNYLIFGVLCFYSQLNKTKDHSKVSYSSTEQAISTFFTNCSLNIHMHQQISTKKIIAATVLGASTLNISHIEDVIHLSTDIFQQLHALGKQRCHVKGLVDKTITQQLPPRPPLKLWDVPRFIGYCKSMGILSTVGSLSELWQLFGPVLIAAYPASSTQGWGRDVVGPLPIQVTVDKVCELLSSIPTIGGDKEITEEIGTLENLFLLMQQVLVPFLSGFVDDLISVALLEEKKRKHSNESFLTTYADYTSIISAIESGFSSGNENSGQSGNGTVTVCGIDESAVLLEDLLRYGGDRMVASARFLAPWVGHLYETLRPSLSPLGPNKLEPLSLNISQYLSSSSVISLPTVSMIIKQSMAPRTRVVPGHSSGAQSSRDIGVSLNEFEEILIRCAFVLWSDVGALMINVSDTAEDTYLNKIVVQIFETMTSKFPSLSVSVIGKYCEECRYAFVQNHQKKKFSSQRQASGSTFHSSVHGMSGGKTEGGTEGRLSWGVDFFAPFCAFLNETASLPVQKASIAPPPPFTPAELFQEPTRPKALQLPVPAVQDVIDFQEKEEVRDDTNDDVTKMIESWGGNKDSTARNESKTFDATKGLLSHQVDTSSNSSNSPRLPTLNTQKDAHFNIEGPSSNKSRSSADNSGFQAISSSKLRESLSPSQSLRPASDTSSPHSIVSRSEEMLAHILAMRTSTPTGDSSVVSPLKDSTESTPAPAHTQPKQQLKQQQQELMPTFPSSQTSRDLVVEGVQMTANKHEKSLQIITSPFSASISPSPSPNGANNDELLEGTKEALWPVFATYCSCGDSSEPGKLSGPNLFALLSKLDLLTDETMTSDLGVLLHQISAHSLSQTPSSMMGLSTFNSHGGVLEVEQSPLLSFEEFIVFLCAFAQLRFEGEVKLPSWSVSPSKPVKDSSKKEENWFFTCNTMYMSKNKSFKKLLEECVLPPLKKRLLLASPEDARHRDECSLIFSLETLFSIESVETNMLSLFKADQRNMRRYLAAQAANASNGQSNQQQAVFEDPIVAALARIKIIPQIVSEHEVMQLIADILPSIHSNKTLSTSHMWLEMKFPQWQWVICVIAFKAVTFSIQKGQAEGKIKNLSSLVGEVITTMTAAMMTYHSSPEHIKKQHKI